MTGKEVAILIYTVKANYPKFYGNMDKNEFDSLASVWLSCLGDYEFNIAQAGLKLYFTTEKSGFPPTVGQVIDCIHKITDREDDTITELDAWGMVYKAICNSNYNAEQEYDKLPNVVKKSIGNYSQLKQWAMLDTNEVQTVIQSNFMRSYRQAKSDDKDYRRMSSDIRDAIDKQSDNGYTKIE